MTHVGFCTIHTLPVSEAAGSSHFSYEYAPLKLPEDDTSTPSASMIESVRSFPRRFRDTTDGDPTRAKLVGAPGLVAQTHPRHHGACRFTNACHAIVSASATHTTHADRCAVRLRTLAWACRHKHRVPCQHADSCRLAAQVLPPVSEKKFTEGHPKLKICVTGAGGFIASHLSKRMRDSDDYMDMLAEEVMSKRSSCSEPPQQEPAGAASPTR